MNLFQHMCPRKQTGCHHVLTQIILLATEFVLVTLWGYCHISPSHQWSRTLRLTACCTLSEVLILQVTRVTHTHCVTRVVNPQDGRDFHISLEMPTILN